MEQRYTSSLLTHFVAREKSTPDEQFAVLLAILRSGALLSQTARMNPQLARYKTMHAASRIEDNDNLNLLYSLDVICFADIPATDLGLHIKKYSPFGITFSKEFLIQRGASPVFYICANSHDPVEDADLESIFRKGLQAFVEWSESHWADESKLLRFLTEQVFPMMKFWTYSPVDNAENNYYMEREWRVPTRVDFSLCDIYRLILPRDYVPRLREDFREYDGEVLCSPIEL